MKRDILGMIRRGLRKPPHVIAARLAAELAAESERLVAPKLARSFGTRALLRALGKNSIDQLWHDLGDRPFPLPQSVSWSAVVPEDERREILSRADKAVGRRVALLGSGDVELGRPIDWHTDFKTGHRWPPAFHRSIEYNNPERPSDVKVPWELSRLQWLMPAGQAYLLTGEERYAEAVRSVLEEWIEANPYALSVNWACTMEAALRILVWTWFFHVFKDSRAWDDEEFRGRFLASLYLHGRFTERHLEKSDVNGNHYTADAAGLVFAGLFFGQGRGPHRWLDLGWRILCDELPKQVTADGVDYEASVPYHRLVAELFLLPAHYRMLAGHDVTPAYRKRVVAMGRFTAAYTREAGTVPLLGDADDARALPLGTQPINDHRYLVGLIGEIFSDDSLRGRAGGPMGEVRWLLGPQAAERLETYPAATRGSEAFAEGGVYVMANPRDHVFVDCGPIGLAGRGGHGHNDCLSFEAVLDGVHLVSDAGAYLYTASYEERNRFRATASHNTPQIDGEEINRFIRPDYLWNLHYDAVPDVRLWQPGETSDKLVAGHAGYQRLAHPVRPVRSYVLEHANHTLTIEDSFEEDVAATHLVEVPLLLAPGVEAEVAGAGKVLLRAAGRNFHVTWYDPQEWTLSLEEGRVSPSYGVVVPAVRLLWRRQGRLCPFRMTLAPAG